jgi:hypothetical protein
VKSAIKRKEWVFLIGLSALLFLFLMVFHEFWSGNNHLRVSFDEWHVGTWIHYQDGKGSTGQPHEIGRSYEFGPFFYDHFYGEEVTNSVVKPHSM